MKTDINEILTRGVNEIIDPISLKKRLGGKKKLRVKLGIDPTAKAIHIGRAVVLWKLRALQDAGHKIVLIIGDFTGLIGDTSDKDSERPMLSPKQVKENMKNYISQFGKIVDLKKSEIHYNSKWLKKLGYLEIAEQADQFSLHEFEARENIARRTKEQKRISLRELLYPLMQGYDSVAIKADLEVGGTDQRFNLLAGRVLQRFYKQTPQEIMTFDLLEGTDGRKMSSSWGNVINITDSSSQMFGKTMSILDRLIVPYFVMCTPHISLSEIEEIEKGLKSGKLNPRDVKARLATELVRLYHGNKAAEAAMIGFDRVHKDKGIPTNLKGFKLAERSIIEVLIGTGLAQSNTVARRLIDQGGVKINSKTCESYISIVPKDSIVQVGKRNFVKII
ncbi:MAG: tyrosyl-tRNA synthetase [Candidatus Doudnabacteria bacterium Gr01-1014_77]|uniref:Tyrosine--tRNA ligase n=1 Tax=Candidatus Doudnabacteria bacterium Gr01-1014_77 TaxID=2017133 RepID=A0A554JA60_9BACT|nr:MAG: tyrosyl-tRNA synthetase [Candidatus Doudnabacteria bacterium Gr01-1014_77]